MDRAKNSLIWIVAVLVFALAWSPDPPSDEKRLQDLVEKIRGDHSLPGISVAIAEGSERPLLATAGFADLEQKVQVKPETSFFIGSVSKNVFAAVALMLVDEGRLDLDDTLSSFVDWPQGEKVTVRMLLNHSSGIPDYLTKKLYEKKIDGVPEFFSSPHPPSQILAKMPSRAPAFEPGSEQEYSNTNALLVGQIIEKITGHQLVTALEERVANPLKLRHMYLYGATTTNRARARGYSGSTSWGASSDNLVDCSFADEALPDSADGSIVSSAGDLLRYHRALRNGDLFSDASWAAMNTVEPGRHNGLSYLLGMGPFGPYAGNIGRAMGHVAFSVYYQDLDTYVVMLLNRGDSKIQLRQLMDPWVESRSR